MNLQWSSILRSLIGIVLVAFATLHSAFGAPGRRIDPASQLGAAAIHDSDFVILEKWFWVAPSGQHQGRHKDSNFIVHSGEDFGFHVEFATKKGTLKLKTKLTVPRSPENFPCPTCKPGRLKISSDRRVVTVDTEINSDDGSAGFKWGIDSKDPRGNYKLEFAIDGITIDSYAFTVK